MKIRHLRLLNICEKISLKIQLNDTSYTQQIIGKMEQSYCIQKKDFNTLQYFSTLYLPQSAEKMFY